MNIEAKCGDYVYKTENLVTVSIMTLIWSVSSSSIIMSDT